MFTFADWNYWFLTISEALGFVIAPLWSFISLFIQNWWSL